MALRILGNAARHSGTATPPAAIDDLERHLARCRRSGSAAALLLARASGAAALPEDLGQRLRITDSVVRTGPRELLVLCDAPAATPGCAPLDRDALVRRLRTLAGVRVDCAWASFPEDGLIVDDLLRCARDAVAAQPARHAATLPLMAGGGS